MQKLIILVITLGTLFGCKSQSNKRLTKLTVIYSNNERLDFKMIIDTLIREREINLSDTTIDIFYGNKNFHFPYYVPSGGIYKDSIKNSECDMTIYPQNVKCYKYDNKNRVARMHVSGSGTESEYTYTYNDKDQISAFTDLEDNYLLKYNDSGNLVQIKKVGGLFENIYDFKYQ